MCSHEASEAIKHLQMTEENEENWTRFKKLILLQVRDLNRHVLVTNLEEMQQHYS